jgi:hypothetical protein
MQLLSQKFEEIRFAASMYMDREMKSFQREILSDIPLVIALIGMVIGLFGIYLETWVEQPALGEMYFTLRSLHGYSFIGTIINMASPFLGAGLQNLSLLIILVKPVAIICKGIRNYALCDRPVFFGTLAGLTPILFIVTSF